MLTHVISQSHLQLTSSKSVAAVKTLLWAHTVTSTLSLQYFETQCSECVPDTVHKTECLPYSVYKTQESADSLYTLTYSEFCRC